MPQRADVVVAGAGLAGVACALFLAEAGVEVLLIEAGPSLASGATGASGGLLQVGTAEHPHRLIGALGVERARAYSQLSLRSVRLLRERVPVSEGGLRVGVRDEAAEIEQAVASSLELGVDSELWSADEVAQTLGCVGLGPARFVAEDGLFDPVGAVHAMAAAARQAGARVLTGVALEGVEEDSELSVATSAGTVQAELLVCAAGWPLGRLVPYFADKLIPVRQQWLRTPSGPPLSLGVSGQHGYLWWRAHPQGGWLLGGARWATQHLESWEIEPQPQDIVEQRLLGILGQSWPKVPAQVAARGAGIMTLTCDNLPLCGPLPGRSRIVSCTGFGEHGLALAVAGAKGVAEGILGESEALPELVRPARMVG